MLSCESLVQVQCTLPTWLENERQSETPPVQQVCANSKSASTAACSASTASSGAGLALFVFHLKLAESHPSKRFSSLQISKFACLITSFGISLSARHRKTSAAATLSRFVSSDSWAKLIEKAIIVLRRDNNDDRSLPRCGD